MTFLTGKSCLTTAAYCFTLAIAVSLSIGTPPSFSRLPIDDVRATGGLFFPDEVFDPTSFKATRVDQLDSGLFFVFKGQDVFGRSHFPPPMGLLLTSCQKLSSQRINTETPQGE